MNKSKINFFGDDFFISYSRSDGADYALALANRLADAEYSAYIDQWGAESGVLVPESLLRTLKRAKVLIVVCSGGSKISAAMETELSTFKTTGRPIIPISFGNKLSDSIYENHIAGLAHSLEPVENLNLPKVDDKVFTRITNSFLYVRQRVKIRRLIALLLLLAIILPLIAVYFTYRVKALQGQIEQKTAVLANSTEKLSQVAGHILLLNDTLKINKITLLHVKDSLRGKTAEATLANKDGAMVYNYARALNTYVDTLTGYIYKIGKYYHQPEVEGGFMKENIPYRLFFDYDSSILSPKSAKELDEFSKAFLNNEKLKNGSIEIRGRASSLGVSRDYKALASKWGTDLTYFSYADDQPAAHAMRLAKDMANSVKTYLVNSGIEARRIKVKTMGNSGQIAPASPYDAEFPFVSHADILFKPGN